MKRGRKLIGNSRRVPSSFTVEIDIVKEFKAYCRENGISASFIVQEKIEDFLKEVKK